MSIDNHIEKGLEAMGFNNTYRTVKTEKHVLEIHLNHTEGVLYDRSTDSVVYVFDLHPKLGDSYQ